jgi:hypothetical protein
MKRPSPLQTITLTYCFLLAIITGLLFLKG